MRLALARELDDECFGLAARPMRPGGFALLRHCPLHAATLEQAPRMPASTPRHRLQDEGHSYRAIRDELLRERALEALAEERIGIAEIAETLGFAEPGAFDRAFRKWRGATPAAHFLPIPAKKSQMALMRGRWPPMSPAKPTAPPRSHARAKHSAICMGW